MKGIDELERQVAKWAKRTESRLTESTIKLYMELMVDWVQAVWDAAKEAAPASRSQIIADRKTIGWRVWGDAEKSMARLQPILDSFRGHVRQRRLAQLRDLRRQRRTAR